MSADHSLRRLLARICSADTMQRLVDPVLADMRFESERPAWRGYVALARALTVHGVTSLPAFCSRLYHDDERALPRGIAVCALAALILAVPLVAVPAKSALRLSWYVVILLVPQALGLALPMSVLIAIPMALRKASNRRRLVMHGLVLSAVCAVANLVVMIHMIPDANQAFRVEIQRQVHPTHGGVTLTPGPMEMTLHELRGRIQAAQATGDRLTPDGLATARRLEYVYQLKLALSAIPLPLGLLAIAITIASRGRLRSITIGTASAFAYVYTVWALDSWTVTLFQRSDVVSPAMFAWAPGGLIAALALAVFWTGRPRGGHSWA